LLLNKSRVLSEHGPFREQEWILAVIYHTQTAAYPAGQYKLMAVTYFFVLYLLYVAETVSPGFKTTACVNTAASCATSCISPW